MDEAKPIVAVVDDDPRVRESLESLIESAGLTARVFSHAEDFLRGGHLAATGCLITDVRMPGMSGLELQAELNDGQRRIPTIFITAHGDEKMRIRALKAGAMEFLAKPFDDEALLENVRAALER